MSTLIFGAGAIGQWLGALLHSSGSDVKLHVRPSVAQELQANGGITLDGERTYPIPITTTLEEIASTHFETIICTVKTYAVQSALSDLKSSGVTFHDLVAFQNGWGTDDLYLDTFPEARLWTLTTTRAVGMDRPGRLSPAPKGGLAVAPWGGSVAGAIPKPLRKVSIPLVVLQRGLDLKWSKLLLNLIGNATGAITGLSPRNLAAHPRLMKAELLLAREAIAVGEAMGVKRRDLPGFPVVVLSTALAQMPLRVVGPLIGAKMKGARGDKLPSLFADLQDPSRPTELDAMNGAVVKEGERLGVATPKQKALVDLFHRCRRDQELWTQLQRDPIRLLEYV